MIHHVEQYSPDWWKLRWGRVTASMVWAIVKKRKRGAGDLECRVSYRLRLVAQTLIPYAGQHDDDYKGPEAEWGMEFEGTARAQYEVRNGCVVSETGFIVHDAIERFGASPDGMVGTEGLIQIKCPATTTHIDYLQAGVVPEEYEPQMVAEMACSGRKWSDFVSFDPRMPKDLQLFVVRLPRDEKRIAEVELAVESFLAEVDAAVLRLQPNWIEQKLQESLVSVLDQGREEIAGD